MKLLGFILSFAVLAACEATNSTRAQTEAQPERSGSGISVSGYARAGVSKTF